ncbi:LysR family transcriptional regulator [Acinetobacter sp. MD2(2019)]|uniref:LysR family transcriptional regulator n=1 Tax=Acinetobacter sp. MD2(2019) TaxID=2605273 RepID=UPI002D1F54EF|nr:LysR family transcriptional regulator [Acinetobacter sp. MD2(2019)]MEB3753719.1 LysR family transcriptional regulator [Acinetobacter sp. MD2(2019)]
MNYKGLECFYWVVRLNSFNKAALKLNLTQSAISQRIASIERELAVRLLERTSRTIQVTDSGQVAFQYAEKIIELNHQLLEEVSKKSAIETTIRLGVAETIVHSWLVNFIEKVYEEFPHVTIDIIVNVTPVLKEAIKTGELDMVFMLDIGCDFDCIEIPLCHYDHALLISPRLAKRFASGFFSFQDLTRNTIITYPKNTYPYLDLKQQLNRLRVHEPKTITSYSLATLVKMTEEGMGVGIIPYFSVLKELREKRLLILPTDIPLRPYQFSCVYTDGRDEMIKQRLADLAVATAKECVWKLKQQFSHEDFIFRP